MHQAPMDQIRHAMGGCQKTARCPGGLENDNDEINWRNCTKQRVDIYRAVLGPTVGQHKLKKINNTNADEVEDSSSV